MTQLLHYEVIVYYFVGLLDMATNKPQDEFVKTALRLPKELHTQVHESARLNGRSFNSEIVQRLDESIKYDAYKEPVINSEKGEVTVDELMRLLFQYVTQNPGVIDEMQRAMHQSYDFLGSIQDNIIGIDLKKRPKK